MSLLTSFYTLKSSENVDGTVSKVTSMCHEFKQWKGDDIKSKHIFIFSSVTYIFVKNYQKNIKLVAD